MVTKQWLPLFVVSLLDVKTSETEKTPCKTERLVLAAAAVQPLFTMCWVYSLGRSGYYWCVCSRNRGRLKVAVDSITPGCGVNALRPQADTLRDCLELRWERPFDQNCPQRLSSLLWPASSFMEEWPRLSVFGCSFPSPPVGIQCSVQPMCVYCMYNNQAWHWQATDSWCE